MYQCSLLLVVRTSSAGVILLWPWVSLNEVGGGLPAWKASSIFQILEPYTLNHVLIGLPQVAEGVKGLDSDASVRFVAALRKIEFGSGRYPPGAVLLAQDPVDLSRHALAYCTVPHRYPLDPRISLSRISQSQLAS